MEYWFPPLILAPLSHMLFSENTQGVSALLLWLPVEYGGFHSLDHNASFPASFLVESTQVQRILFSHILFNFLLPLHLSNLSKLDEKKNVILDFLPRV